MQSYELFAKKELEKYIALPEEGSEVYKRHHIDMHGYLDGIAMDADKGNEKDLRSIGDNISKWIGIEFDAIIGSGCEIIKNQKIRITTLKEDSTTPNQNAFLDKYASLINSMSNRVINISAANNEEASFKILFLNADSPLFAHVNIYAGANSKLNVIEYFGSLNNAKSASATIHNIESKSGSLVELNSIHNESENTAMLSFAQNSIEDAAVLKMTSYYNGSCASRVRNIIDAAANRSMVHVCEVMFASKSQKFDINTHIINSGRDSMARLETKAVADDSSFCMLKGFAHIKKGAQRANSYVHERGIIINKAARIDGLPDMSVDESDVKATHSSATSPIDDELSFYLMSRGIGAAGVKRLVISGFLGDIINHMNSASMRDAAIALINGKIRTSGYGDMPSLEDSERWSFDEHMEKDIFKGHYKYR